MAVLLPAKTLAMVPGWGDTAAARSLLAEAEIIHSLHALHIWKFQGGETIGRTTVVISHRAAQIVFVPLTAYGTRDR